MCGGILILLAVCLICFYALEDYSVYFYTPKEAVTKSADIHHKEIRVGGMIKTGSVKWLPNELYLRFVLSDLKGVEIKVDYQGAPPDMFKEGSGVVVEGYISKNGGKLSAKGLFVKHSEEYRVPEDIHHLDPSLVQKSIIKNELL